VKNADSYAQQLERDGAVIPSFANRRTDISRQLHAAAVKSDLNLVDDDLLLDEVTALVERPNVVIGQFEKEYLAVPQECLILTMKANQKYFPLFEASGKLSNKFLVVSNVKPVDQSRIVEGNERVVRPRLADAKFFFEQDIKKPLISHLDGLGRVVYHNKLGTQLDRVTRIRKLTAKILDGFQNVLVGNVSMASEAADLCKCDLLTNMVGEFPELQGTMGFYYALLEGKNAEVAESIREHYLPRGSGDQLPCTITGQVLALADKLDTIASMFAIGEHPTGARDPFGVRRAAIGFLRIVIECKLSINLDDLLGFSLLAIQADMTKAAVARWEMTQAATVPPVGAFLVKDAIYDYVMERLRGLYLENSAHLKVTTEMFDAVLANRPASPYDFDRRLHALHAFLKLPDAPSLAAANKRIGNILKKSGLESFAKVNAELLRDPAEQVLHEQVVAMTKVTEPLFAARDYTQMLSKLAGLRAAVDAFFDGVMVMADDEKLRNNRLALLAQLRGLFLRVADLSRLPG
jgi:glycyl-tRNA synthetase beta chain